MASKTYFDSDDEFEVLGPEKEEKPKKENSDSGERLRLNNSFVIVINY